MKSADSERDLFERHLADYRQDYRRLMQSRGLDMQADWFEKPVSAASMAACLEAFYADAPVGILLYFYLGESLNLWLITREGVRHAEQLPLRIATLTALETELKAGLQLVQRSRTRAPHKRGMKWKALPSATVPPPAESLQRLSRLLFPPELARQLEDLQDGHLIIVPALNIQQLPLALLQPFDDERRLIDLCSYSFAANLYDIAGLVMGKKSEQSVEASYQAGNPAECLLAGNPRFTTEGDWVLPPLPEAEKEVRAVFSRFFPDADPSVQKQTVLTGEAATRARVLERLPATSLLYVATHGIADPDNSLDGSGLFFTPGPGNPLGFWTAREIQALKLRADLVVLSACQTGLGEALDAGVTGLSRAFHLAGADNIVMSLWSVDDRATRELMCGFADQLLIPQAFFPAGPLRRAMLAYRELEQDPLYWASFATFGIPY